MGGLAELSDPNAPQSSQLSQILFEAFLWGSGHLYIYICVKIRKRRNGVTLYSYNTYFQHISSSIVDYCVHPRNFLLPP